MVLVGDNIFYYYYFGYGNNIFCVYMRYNPKQIIKAGFNGGW